MYRYCQLYCQFIPFLLLLSYEQNISPVTLISKNNRARIEKSLFKVKLLALVIQLTDFLKRNFPYTYFLSANFQSNCPSEFLLVACSERLNSKAPLSNTRKWSQNQETLACALQIGHSACFSTQWLYWNLTPPWIFFEELSNLFEGNYFTIQLWMTACKGSLFD